MNKIKMRGKRLENQTKPGWESGVTVRKARGKRSNLRFVVNTGQDSYECQASAVWDIFFMGCRMSNWKLAASCKGYFLCKGTFPWSTLTTRGPITSITRRAVSNVPDFWRDVLVTVYEGRDPQCEDCSSGSPVPHIPFTPGHAIHCTCSGCF
jgi:hypothetical protein